MGLKGSLTHPQQSRSLRSPPTPWLQTPFHPAGLYSRPKMSLLPGRLRRLLSPEPPARAGLLPLGS